MMFEDRATKPLHVSCATRASSHTDTCFSAPRFHLVYHLPPLLLLLSLCAMLLLGASVNTLSMAARRLLRPP